MFKEPAAIVAMWTFLGVVATGVVAIFTELIRNGRKTDAVKSEVVDSVNALTKEVKDLKLRVDGHIQWHFERGNQHGGRHRY